MKQTMGFLWALALLAVGGNSIAQDECSITSHLKNVDEIESTAQLGSLIIVEGINGECYFGTNDSLPWVEQARQRLVRENFGDLNNKAKLENLQSAVRITRRALMLESGALPYKEIFIQDLSTWQTDLARIPEHGPTTYLEPISYFTLDGNGLQFGTAFDLNAPLDDVCAPENWKANKDSCLTAIKGVEKSLRYLFAMSAINGYAGHGDMRDVLAGLTELDLRWTAYFEEARPQNPLELVWNSSRSPKNTDGFAPVPNQQIILIHPGIALEYVDDSPDGNQFQESLIVEIIGMNRWTWGPGGKMKRPLGLSVIAAYSDRPNVDDLGWGLMAHINNKFSFGVTRRGGETGLFVSLDLQQFFTKWTSEKKAKFESYKELLDFQINGEL